MTTVKVSYQTVFNRTKKLDRNGKASVLIEAYQSRVRRYWKTGIRLSPNEWDERSKEVKKRPDLNRLIRDKINELEHFELTFSARYNRPFQLSDFDLLHSAKANIAQSSVSFTTFALEQIARDYADKTINKITYGRYKRVVNLLTTFSQGPAVPFSVLTYSLIDAFHHHLRIVDKLELNTIYKHHQVVQKYLTRAIKKGLFEIKDNPYNDFKPKKAPVESTVLLPAEIERIEQLSFTRENEHLEFYRDTFLFAYYTLLRIGDVTQLKINNLLETDIGLVLELRAQKTGKLNRLALYQLHRTADGPSKPEKLIRKYWRTDKRPLFARSHPRLNEYVKDVVRLAGINKPVTFHTSRHSGITFLSTVLPTPVVQQLAQHSSIATTMGYIHISRHQIEHSLSQVKWF
ncbi:tyrosine-type recombinase/integrase [Spirosoma arcticum]